MRFSIFHPILKGSFPKGRCSRTHKSQRTAPRRPRMLRNTSPEKGRRVSPGSLRDAPRTPPELSWDPFGLSGAPRDLLGPPRMFPRFPQDSPEIPGDSKIKDFNLISGPSWPRFETEICLLPKRISSDIWLPSFALSCPRIPKSQRTPPTRSRRPRNTSPEKVWRFPEGHAISALTVGQVASSGGGIMAR